MGAPREVLERGGGLGPKSLCTKNGPTRFSLLQIVMPIVTLLWRGGAPWRNTPQGGPAWRSTPQVSAVVVLKMSANGDP